MGLFDNSWFYEALQCFDFPDETSDQIADYFLEWEKSGEKLLLLSDLVGIFTHFRYDMKKYPGLIDLMKRLEEMPYIKQTIRDAINQDLQTLSDMDGVTVTFCNPTITPGDTSDSQSGNYLPEPEESSTTENQR